MNFGPTDISNKEKKKYYFELDKSAFDNANKVWS